MSAMNATMTPRPHFLSLLLALSLAVFASTPAAIAAEETPAPPRQRWSFSGPFGKFDQGQLQRGFKVYREVCAACHSLSMIAFRNLAEPGGPGYSTAQAQAVAAEYKIQDGPNDQGEMFERPGRLADYFPKPFPNDQAARVANGGALPPDLSVIAKARTYERGFPWFLIDAVTQYQEQGPDYIVALLNGYKDEPPQGFTLTPGTYYNTYFPGHAIGMPKPLNDGQVEYTDGTPATVDQYAKDVTAFLMWAAEPHMQDRKRLGFQVMIFLIVFAGLMYFTKKRVWHATLDHTGDVPPHHPSARPQV
jgi:cytochrome c1